MTTDTPTRAEINCTTGEVTIVPLTADEISEMEAMRAFAEAHKAEREAEESARAEAKVSAQAKLAALGLTPEEISAL